MRGVRYLPVSLLQRNTSNKLSWNILKAFYVAFIQSNNLRIEFGRVFIGVLIENVVVDRVLENNEICYA